MQNYWSSDKSETGCVVLSKFWSTSRNGLRHHQNRKFWVTTRSAFKANRQYSSTAAVPLLHVPHRCTKFSTFESIILNLVIQGRSVTLTGFWFSVQKQIKKIYRYQIQVKIHVKIGLNRLFSTKCNLCPSSDDFKFSALYTGYCTLYMGCCTY